MSRRSNGVVGVWAEMQRQQQRQMQAEARRQREEAQQARAYQRRAAQSHREYRQAEALRRTEELEAQVAALQGLLVTGCSAPVFRASSLMRTESVEPFAPGPLALPVPMPDLAHYQAQGGWTAARRAQAQADAGALRGGLARGPGGGGPAAAAAGGLPAGVPSIGRDPAGRGAAAQRGDRRAHRRSAAP